MHFFWFILKIIFFSALILLLIRILLVWLAKPAKYGKVDQLDIQRFLSSWGYRLSDRGKIFLSIPKFKPYLIIIKREYKTRDHILSFQIRYELFGKELFKRLEETLKKKAIQYQLQMTKKKVRPRSLNVDFKSSDPFMPTGIANLAKLIFLACETSDDLTYKINCTGNMDIENPNNIPVLIPSTNAYRLGAMHGSLIRRILSPFTNS